MNPRADFGVRYLRAYLASAHAGSQVSLEALRHIEATVDLIVRLQDDVRGDLGQIAILAESIESDHKSRVPVDPEGEFCDASLRLEEAQRAIIDLTGLIQKRAVGQEDVVRECGILIDLGRSFVSAIQDLRWRIMEQDADSEEPDPTIYSSAEELIAALNADD